MKRILSLILLVFQLFYSNSSQAQESIENLSDSSLIAHIRGKEDTAQIKYYIEIAKRLQIIFEDDSSIAYVNKALEIANNFDYHRYDYLLYDRLCIAYTYGEKIDSNFAFKALKDAAYSAKKYNKNNLSAVLNSTVNLASGYSILGQNDTAIYLGNKISKVCKEKRDTAKLFNSYNWLVTFYLADNQIEVARSVLDTMIQLAHYASDALTKGNAYSKIAGSYYELGQTPQCLFYQLKAATVYKDSAYVVDEFYALNAVSNTYYEINNYAKAVEYSKKGLDIILNDREYFQSELPNQYNDIGWNYRAAKKTDSAFKYFKLAYQEFLNTDPSDLSIAYPIGNLGLIYTELGETDSAIFYSNKAKELFEKQDYIGGIGESFINIGKAYYLSGNYEKAKDYLRRGLLATIEDNDPNQMMDAYEAIYKVNRAQGKYLDALEAIESYLAIKDSVFSLEQLNAAQELETSLARDKDEAMIAALESQAALKEAELEQQKLLNYGIAAVGIIILLSLVFIFKSWKAKKKAFDVLHQQHLELESNKIQIEEQKNQIEEQHDDIIASIDFASRIQKALLKPEEQVNKEIPEHFIYFKPRDIVSGDFYWAFIREHFLYIAAVDCTGHGVPGAMMSMLGISFLNEITANPKVLETGEILNSLRSKIIKELGQDKVQESNYREGMDMSLIRLDLSKNKLQFSGANNPLYLFRNDKLIEVKGDKQAISYSEQMQEFSSHNLELIKGDCIYLFSDGYADQFGGDKGKKLMYKPFKRLLQKSLSQPLNKQKELLAEYFEEWKGDLEQVDDICVIGMRI